MRWLLGLFALLAMSSAGLAQPAGERIYRPRDLGIDCVRAPCASWEALDPGTGTAVRFAGLEWVAPLTPSASVLADLAAGRLLVRATLITGRYPAPDTRVPVLRITAIVGPGATDQRVYWARDNGIRCIQAPCENWSLTDSQTGQTIRAAGIVLAVQPEPADPAALLREIAAGHWLVRGELQPWRFPDGMRHGGPMILRVTAIVARARR